MEILEVFDYMKVFFPILYYATCCGFFLISLSFLINEKIKIKESSLSDLISLLATITIIIIISAKEPIIFLFSVIIVIILQTPKIIKFISDNSYTELNKYKEHYTRIADQDVYTFLEILVIYNLISMEDYLFLFIKHADKTEEEMLKILEERVILDEDKKETAMILFNQYKLNKKIVERNKVIEDIKNNLSNNK